MRNEEARNVKALKAFLNQYRDANRGIQRMESRRRIPELYGMVMEQPKVMSATINEED